MCDSAHNNQHADFEKDYASLNSILKQIKSPDSIGFKGGRETLRRILKEMGFVWRKSTGNRKLLMERSDIVAQRINFLRQMMKYMEEGRDIVYTDELYVNAGHAVTRCWPTDTIGLTAPISKGERMINCSRWYNGRINLWCKTCL